MTKKYTIYNNKNEIIFESNDMLEVNCFIEYNIELGDLLYLHKENNIFIMYFVNYTIYMKM